MIEEIAKYNFISYLYTVRKIQIDKERDMHIETYFKIKFTNIYIINTWIVISLENHIVVGIIYSCIISKKHYCTHWSYSKSIHISWMRK